MREIKDIENFNDFIEEYKLYNEKIKYFKIDFEGNIKISAPSYILEFGYIYFKGYKEILKYIDFKDIYVKKDKKIERCSSLDIEILKERFFRAIFNRDDVHSLKLANEIIRRNDKLFFEIIYLNAKLSLDNNRLIKVYLFEKIYNENGLILPLLSNLINYITKSKEGYSNEKKYDKLYSYIYNLKFKDKIEFENEKFDSEINKEIYLFLKGENNA